MQVKHIFFFVSFLLYLNTKCLNNKPGLTFKLNEGRLGDNLINYCKARWLANKYNLKLYYPYFKYVDQLNISKHHKQKTKKSLSYFKGCQHIKDYNSPVLKKL